MRNTIKTTAQPMSDKPQRRHHPTAVWSVVGGLEHGGRRMLVVIDQLQQLIQLSSISEIN